MRQGHSYSMTPTDGEAPIENLGRERDERGMATGHHRGCSSLNDASDARIVTSPNGPLYVMARVAQQLGRDRQAIDLFDRLRSKPRWVDISRFRPIWGYISLSHLHSAVSYEQLGERVRAREAYERFIEVWSDAEPELRHYLEQAEEGLARSTAGAR